MPVTENETDKANTFERDELLKTFKEIQKWKPNTINNFVNNQKIPNIYDKISESTRKSFSSIPLLSRKRIKKSWDLVGGKIVKDGKAKKKKKNYTRKTRKMFLM